MLEEERAEQRHDLPLHEMPGGAGAFFGLAFTRKQPIQHVVAHGERDFLRFGEPFQRFIELAPDDLAHRLVFQRAEHDDAIDAVEQFRPEPLVQLFLHEGIPARG